MIDPLATSSVIQRGVSSVAAPSFRPSFLPSYSCPNSFVRETEALNLSYFASCCWIRGDALAFCVCCCCISSSYGRSGGPHGWSQACQCCYGVGWWLVIRRILWDGERDYIKQYIGCKQSGRSRTMKSQRLHCSRRSASRHDTTRLDDVHLIGLRPHAVLGTNEFQKGRRL